MDPRMHMHAAAAAAAAAGTVPARFPSDQQARLQRHGQETQRRAEQLERARQANAISPGDYNKQLHLASFSYLANIMAMREQKRQNAPAFHQRSMY